MITCKYCHEEWSYSYRWKAMYAFRNNMKCPRCGMTNYITKESRWKISCIYYLGNLPLLLALILTDLSVVLAVGLCLIILATLTLITPRYLDLSKEEEPFW